MYENQNISGADVQDIIEKVKNFISNSYVSYLKKEIWRLSEFDQQNVIAKALGILDENNDSFYNYRTEQLRFKAYEKYCGFILPANEEIYIDPVVGTDKDAEDEDEPNEKVIYVSIKASYIPLSRSLAALLQTPGILKEIMIYMDLAREKTVVSNIVQSQ